MDMVARMDMGTIIPVRIVMPCRRPWWLCQDIVHRQDVVMEGDMATEDVDGNRKIMQKM
jgi:hypothetical protein